MQKKPEIEVGSVGTESEYCVFSSEEVRRTALDLLSGTCFGSWQIRKSDRCNLSTIFLPLVAIDDLVIKGWERDGVVHFIGHMGNSLMMAINGYPIFTKMRVVNHPDLMRIEKMIKALEAVDEPA